MSTMIAAAHSPEGRGPAVDRAMADQQAELVTHLTTELRRLRDEIRRRLSRPFP